MKNVDEMTAANLRRWDEKAQANWNSHYYDLDGFLRKKDSLLPLEVREVGDVNGKNMLHLQCHFGMDSLSWAGRGATVTGVDFSAEAIRLARELSRKIEVPAKFINSNVYDLESVLQTEFDIVYTSYGVLCWLPDLGEWGRLIAKYLRPGGFFYIVEGHPFGNMIDENVLDHFQAGYPYFDESPEMFDDDHVVDQGHDFQNKERFEWFHSMSEIINSLVSQGLHLEFVHEFSSCFFPMHPRMQRHDDGYWYLPEGEFNVPMMFSLKASKPFD
ncbi:MAG: class I SAM-dependent methyltransferase [Methanomassiliicoccales archaeon]|nr:class I SAM-dependent methyltransferase [Methanomassiliicoccales archaeon]TFG56143.1 MAG: class I SAM-dependent methyltransferase [Methanomassiliicoccus sp.]